jgi:hypothetical protein
MKDKIRYISLVAVFIIFIFSITITNLLLKYDETGSFVSNKEYFEIRFSNVRVNYDIDTKIMVNNEDNSLHFELSNLNDYIEEKEFYIDVTNIGNKNAYVSNMYLTNIDTNENEDKIDIYTSINNGDTILGGEQKILIVRVKYNSKESKDKKYYNFNLNYNYDKVSL